jgi:hypothetical protein
MKTFFPTPSARRNSRLLDLFRKPSRKPKPKWPRSHYRPLLEYLEDRVAPAVNVNLDQFANANFVWQNGNLNGNNSAYSEGSVVPFRLQITGLTPGASETIHINYDFTAGGHEAYDFLATYDATEPLTEDDAFASGGGNTALAQSILELMTTDPILVDFPDDPFEVNGLSVSDAQAFSGVDQQLTIYGVSAADFVNQANPMEDPEPVHEGPTDGNSTGDLLLSFTPMEGGSGAVFLVWGGHLAQSAYWFDNAPPNGAGQISGAPWHMRTLNLTEDGVSSGGKNQDRSIQPSALVEPVTPTVTTEIHLGVTDDGTPTIVTTPQPLGTAVHDSVLVTGTNGDVTGTATFSFYQDGGVIGVQDAGDVLLATSNPLDLTNGAVDAQGLFPTGSSLGALPAGHYYYIASYDPGDNPNYLAADSDLELLTIDKAQLTITTEVHNASDEDITNGNVPLGSVVHDTATVSGAVEGFAIGDVSFTLNGGMVGNNGTENGAFRSADSAPLNLAGAYVYQASVVGNDNYIGDTSEEEPFTVPKSALGVLTTDTDPDSGLVGVILNDSATLSGAFNPTGSITFYLFAPGDDPNVTGDGATYSESVTVDMGNNTYDTQIGFVSDEPGIWHWVAVYSGDVNNVGTNSGLFDEPVELLVRSQITPTGTTAEDFANEEAATLPAIFYTDDGTGHIANNVTEGSFFYYSFVTASAGDTIIVDETVPAQSPALFPILIRGTGTGNLALWDATGTTPVAPGFDDGNGDVHFIAPSDGTFIVGVKYDSNSLKGSPVPNDPPVIYTWETIVDGTVQARATLDLQPAAPLLATSEGSGVGTESLTDQQLNSAVDAAIARWVDAGLDAEQISALHNTPVHIGAFLDGTILGLASHDEIWINPNAAGWGWSLGGNPAPGRVDLLTVVEHELGHLLFGFDHSDTGIMQATLAPGVGLSLSSSPVAAAPAATSGLTAEPSALSPRRLAAAPEVTSGLATRPSAVSLLDQAIDLALPVSSPLVVAPAATSGLTAEPSALSPRRLAAAAEVTSGLATRSSAVTVLDQPTVLALSSPSLVTAEGPSTGGADIAVTLVARAEGTASAEILSSAVRSQPLLLGPPSQGSVLLAASGHDGSSLAPSFNRQGAAGAATTVALDRLFSGGVVTPPDGEQGPRSDTTPALPSGPEDTILFRGAIDSLFGEDVAPLSEGGIDRLFESDAGQLDEAPGTRCAGFGVAVAALAAGYLLRHRLDSREDKRAQVTMARF